MSSTYTAIHDPFTGRFVGVLRSDGAQVPRADGNADWQEFVTWNETADPPVLLDDVPGLTAAEVLAQTRMRALQGLLARADDTAIGVRAFLVALIFLMNNRLEFLFNKVAGQLGVTPEELAEEFGAPFRVLQSEILAYIGEHPTSGDPAPPT